MKLEVEGLSFAFSEGDAVLKEVCFSAHAGELICLLGHNGAGKTTLFRCLLGLAGHYTGRACVDGVDLAAMSEAARARHLAHIPQRAQTPVGFTAQELVLMGTTAHLSAFAMPGKRERDAAQEALALVGIERMAARRFERLSGGEQQLVLVARALAQQTRLLLMDEPCASLDYGNQARVMGTARALTRQGYLVLLSLHSPEQALLYADRVLVLHEGRVERFGPPRAVLDEQLLERIYGVPVRLYILEDGRMACLPRA